MLQIVDNKLSKEVVVSVVSKTELLENLQGPLDDLCNNLCQPNVYYEPWFLIPAIQHLSRKSNIFFLCMWTRGENPTLCGFFPLSKSFYHRLLPISVLSFWNHSQCFRCSPLIRRNYADMCWSAFFNWFERGRHKKQLLRFPKLNAHSEVDRTFRQYLELSNSLWFARFSQTSAFLEIDTSADTTLRQAMSAKSLKKYRRKEKLLSKLGQVEYLEIDANTNIETLIDEFLELEASGWKQERGTALAVNPEEKVFFREIIRGAFNRRRLSFLCLRFDGRLIAARTEFITSSGSFLFKSAYDETFAEYSPGMLLAIEAVRRMHIREDEIRKNQNWSDSCSTTTTGASFKCWPGRIEIVEYLVTTNPRIRFFVERVLPQFRRLYLAQKNIRFLNVLRRDYRARKRARIKMANRL